MNQKIDTYEIYLQQLFRQDPNATVLVNSAKDLLQPSSTLSDFNAQILSVYSSKNPSLPEHSSEELSTNLSGILKFALSQMEEEIQRVEVAGEGADIESDDDLTEKETSESVEEGGEKSREEGGEDDDDDITTRLQQVSLDDKPTRSDIDELTEQIKQVTIQEGPEETELEESSIESEDEEELRGIIKNGNYYADKILW